MLEFNEHLQGILERKEILNHKDALKNINNYSKNNPIYTKPLENLSPNVKWHKDDFNTLNKMLYFQEHMDAETADKKKRELSEEDNRDFEHRKISFNAQSIDIARDLEEMAKTRNMLELCDEIQKAPRNYTLLLTGEPKSRESEREAVRTAKEVKDVLQQRLNTSQKMLDEKIENLSYMGVENDKKKNNFRLMYAGNNTSDFNNKLNDEMLGEPATAGQARMNAYCKSMFEQNMSGILSAYDNVESKCKNIFIGGKSLYEMSDAENLLFQSDENRNQWMMNKLVITAAESKEKITASPNPDKPDKKIDINPITSEFKNVPKGSGLKGRLQDVCDMFMDYGLLKTPFEMIRRGIDKIKASIKPISMDDLAKSDKQKSRATEWLKKHEENPHEQHKKNIVSKGSDLPAPKKR
jgi:bacterioferritin (cytochrome b1)